MINKETRIKCKKCKYPIAKNNTKRVEEKDIFIAEKENIAIKNNEKSLIARCNLCNKLVGIIIKSKNEIMLFKEKITYNKAKNTK